MTHHQPVLLDLRRRLVSAALVVAAAAGVGLAAGASAAPTSVRQWSHDWVRDAVFYEVFVRSFADSDGDGIGDLAGLTARLDYLNDGDPATGDDLGVTALWLMPIFESPSYHGYDTVDYEAVEADYGSRRDLRRLLRAARRRGIRVIVDFMINHTSSQHPWFADSASSPEAARRDWYVWRPDNPGWTQPWGPGPTWHPGNGAWYYGIFWSGMPDLNFLHPPVRQEAIRLARLWLRRGLDGFRLDAARHLIAAGPGELQNDTPETHAFWREFAAAIRERRPRALLVGENWTDTPTIATYYGEVDEVRGGDELPMNFNFPLAAAVVDGVGRGRADGIVPVLEEMATVYPHGVLDGTFLTNHDQRRLASQLGGSPERLRLAPAILLTLPGTPFLYYGEEVGLANGPGDRDEQKRTPMPWSDEPDGGFSEGEPWFAFAPGREHANVARQTGDPGSLLSHYRRWIRARRASPALRRGGVRLLETGEPGDAVLCFVREAGDERALAAHNLTGDLQIVGPLALAADQLEPLQVDAGARPAGGGPGGWRLVLPPWASGVWRLVSSP